MTPANVIRRTEDQPSDDPADVINAAGMQAMAFRANQLGINWAETQTVILTLLPRDQASVASWLTAPEPQEVSDVLTFALAMLEQVAQAIGMTISIGPATP